MDQLVAVTAEGRKVVPAVRVGDGGEGDWQTSGQVEVLCTVLPFYLRHLVVKLGAGDRLRTRDGQHNGERRPVSGRARRGDRPAVRFDDGLGDGQPQT